MSPTEVKASVAERGWLVAAASGLGATTAASAAALASLCCVGPAVLALLGTSGAVAAAGLTEYRPHLLGVAFALVGFGFWRSLRPSPTAGECGMKTGRIVRVILWVSLVATISAAALPYIVAE